MFGLLDGSQQQSGQAALNNSSLPYLQNESFEVSIGHGIARIHTVQRYLNFNEKEHSHVEFYFPLSKNIVLESFSAELEMSKLCVESSISGNLADSIECKSNENRIPEKVTQHHYPNGIVVGEWVRFKLPVIQAQEPFSVSIVYSQKLHLTGEGFYSFQLPQQTGTASYPISAKIHFEQRESEESIIYHSINHEVTRFQQPILLDDSHGGQGVEHLSIRANYSHDTEKPFIINFQNKDNTHISSCFLSSEEICCSKPKVELNYALVTFVPSQLTGQSYPEKIAQQIKHHQDHNTDCLIDSLKLCKSKSEFIIVLNRSSSMTGPKIYQAIEGISLLLKSLPSKSYFNVISQGSGNKHESLFDSSAVYSQENLMSGLNRIKSFSANLGSSFNLLNSLKHIEGQQSIPHFARQVLVITDSASLENSQEDIQSFLKSSSPAYPVHFINANKGSESLIFNEISNQTGGIYRQSSGENELDSILNLLPRLFLPTLSNFEMHIGGDNGNLISHTIPDIKKLKSVPNNDQISFVVTLKGDHTTFKEQSIEATFKFFNSASNHVEEHKVDLLKSSNKEGSSHISKALKQSLLKFCVNSDFSSISDSNHIKELSAQFSILANHHTSWVTKCFSHQGEGEEKILLKDKPQLSSYREKNNDSQIAQYQQYRKVSGGGNLMDLYDNPDNVNQGNKTEDINNLIDAIFMGEPQKQGDNHQQEHSFPKKSGSVSSSGQHADLLDIGDDNTTTTTSTNTTHIQGSVSSNMAQMGDPLGENDDILDLINNNNSQTQQQHVQVQNNDGNTIDLLDDFLMGDSPSSAQNKIASLCEILDNINFEGLFNSNKFILSSILQGKTNNFISDAPKDLSLDQWSTFAIIASLKKSYQHEAKKWRMIAKKSSEFLQASLPKDNAFSATYQKCESYLQ